MKIFIIGSKGIPAKSGGIERHVEELSIKLVKQGHEVFVYTRKNYTNFSKKTFKGIKLIYLPSIHSKNLDAITHTFLATIHVLSQKADIIHYHGIGPSSLLWIPRIFKRKSKIISTYHSADYKHQKWGAFARWYLRLGEKIACTWAHATIAVSIDQQNYIKKIYKKKAVYIPNGINYPTFDDKKNILQKFNLKSKKYILTVNRLIPHKGIHYLIHAYNKIKTNNKLVIVGKSGFTDNYAKKIKKQAQKNKNIVFTGELNAKELRQIYTHANLYVHPSEYEGLSIALLEALSYGIPVIASDIKPNKESIKDEYGLLFQNKSVKDLTSKINKLLNSSSLQKQLGEKANKMINQEYNWNNITNKTISLYFQITNISKKSQKPKLSRKTYLKRAKIKL